MAVGKATFEKLQEIAELMVDCLEQIKDAAYEYIEAEDADGRENARENLYEPLTDAASYAEDLIKIAEKVTDSRD